MTIILTASQARQILAKHGKITMSAIEQVTGIKAKRAKIKKVNKYLGEIKLLLRLSGIEFEEEVRFHEKRKWRFDLVIKGAKIAVEYEGVNNAKSRHTTITGYSGDAEKYNAAAGLGWTVLRYTVLNFTQVSDDVKKLLTRFNSSENSLQLCKNNSQ